MIKLKKILESPDTVYVEKNNELNFYSLDAYPFALYDDEVYIGFAGGVHPQLAANVEQQIKDASREPTEKEKKFIAQNPNWRNRFDYPGRIWTKSKIISFWEYPISKQIMDKIINKFKEVLNVNLLNYKIEVLYNQHNSLLIKYEDITDAAFAIAYDTSEKYNYFNDFITVKKYIQKYCS